MPNRMRTLALLSVALLLPAPMLWAQQQPTGFFGQITDFETGRPVASAQVVVTVSWELQTRNLTRENGAYQVQVFGGGVYDVAVSGEGYWSQFRRNVPVQDGQTLRLDWALRPVTADQVQGMGRVVGFVQDAQGRGVGNTWLVLVQLGDDGVLHPVGAAVSGNPTGLYELQWYPPGAYGVVAYAPGRPQPLTRDDVRVPAGNAVRVDFMFPAAQQPPTPAPGPAPQ